MDRFIAYSCRAFSASRFDLKSNMDRFIGTSQDKDSWWDPI